MPHPYSEGMPAQAQRKTDAKVYSTRRVLVVDPARFLAEMGRHGVHTDDEIASLLETDRTTIRRIRKGETLPSNGFLAACTATGINYLTFLDVQDRTPSRAA
jgi:hypothetical protein